MGRFQESGANNEVVIRRLPVDGTFKRNLRLINIYANNREGHMRIILSTALLSLLVVALPRSQAPDETRRSDFVERAFAPNGHVRMNLAAGEYRVTASQGNRLRVDWSIKDGARLSDVSARADVRGLEATISTNASSGANLRGWIQVPDRADLRIRLSAGRLTVEGIQGNKDITLNAGELRVAVGRPEDYERVRASVWAGELNAEPFNVSKGGIFRSFDWNGRGPYRLQARLKAGELRLYSTGNQTTDASWLRGR